MDLFILIGHQGVIFQYIHFLFEIFLYRLSQKYMQCFGSSQLLYMSVSLQSRILLLKSRGCRNTLSNIQLSRFDIPDLCKKLHYFLQMLTESLETETCYQILLTSHLQAQASMFSLGKKCLIHQFLYTIKAREEHLIFKKA